jgi:hypothetical protein
MLRRVLTNTGPLVCVRSVHFEFGWRHSRELLRDSVNARKHLQKHYHQSLGTRRFLVRAVVIVVLTEQLLVSKELHEASKEVHEASR